MKILTHPGKAHRDDFLSCCLALHRCYADGNVLPVERRVAHSDDLEDVETWVIDTGEEHDPTLLNFDHHQLEGGDKCALDLVLAHLYGNGPYENYKKDNLWLQQTSFHDIHGSMNAAARMGINQFAYKSLRSPIETMIMEMFSRSYIVQPHSNLHQLMLEQGRSLHCSVVDSGANVLEIFADVPVSTCKGLRVMDLRYTQNYARVNKHNTNRFASMSHVDVSIGLSTRSGNFALYRFPWATEKVDFSRIKCGELSFVHQSGYYAVIGKPSDAVINRMIEESIIENK